MFKTKTSIILFLIAQELLIIIRAGGLIGYPTAIGYAIACSLVCWFLLKKTLVFPAKLFFSKLKQNKVSHANSLPIKEKIAIYASLLMWLCILVIIFVAPLLLIEFLEQRPLF